MAKHILYLHGFNSSPLSEKAVETKVFIEKEFPEVNFHAPQIASHPRAAIEQFTQLISQVNEADNNSEWFFIGSSLGGFFSTYLAQTYQRPAALINPAVKPAQSLEKYIGEQKNPYTNEVFQVEANFIVDLKSLEQDNLLKNNYLLMVQTGDEVLDYREAINFYQHAKVIKQQGGNHRFVNYEKMLPEIVNFFQLA